MTEYAKGSKPCDLDAAKGGPTLGRVRDWQKSEKVGMAGPPNQQNYAKGGPETNDGDGDEPKRKGDSKSMPMPKG